MRMLSPAPEEQQKRHEACRVRAEALMNTHNCVGSSQHLSCAHRRLKESDCGRCQSCLCINADTHRELRSSERLIVLMSRGVRSFSCTNLVVRVAYNR